MSFYKFEEDSLLSGNYVSGSDAEGNGFDLNVYDHGQGKYTYPVNGWYWFDTEEEANVFFNIGVV